MDYAGPSVTTCHPTLPFSVGECPEPSSPTCSVSTHLVGSEGFKLHGIEAAGAGWLEVQTHGYRLEWGHIADDWCHPEGTVISACPDHCDLALGMVHQAQRDRVGGLRPRAATKVHLNGLYADRWGEDGQVAGTVEEELGHGGNIGVLRGWQILKVLQGER